MQARNRPAQNTPICSSELVRELRVRQRPAITQSPCRQHDQEQRREVPALAVEAQDEREKVDRERRDPQERHRRDVLRDVDSTRRAGSSEPVAASAHQSAWRAVVGGGSAMSSMEASVALGRPCFPGVVGAFVRRRLDHPAATQSATKTAYATDQPHACVRVGANGSSRNG
jgi:hypothetical protein